MQTITVEKPAKMELKRVSTGYGDSYIHAKVMDESSLNWYQFPSMGEASDWFAAEYGDGYFVGMTIIQEQTQFVNRIVVTQA